MARTPHDPSPAYRFPTRYQQLRANLTFKRVTALAGKVPLEWAESGIANLRRRLTAAVRSVGGGPTLDPVVEAAMKDLTAFVFRRRRVFSLRLEDREKSLRDRSARAGAIHMFKHLKYHRYTFEPDEVRVWAVNHGWSTRDAHELAEYAEGVLAGTRYHTAPDPFGRDAIEGWRKAAR